MFHAYENAKELGVRLAEVVRALRRKNGELARQIDRAASSVVLNLAEGNHRTGGDRHRMFVIAHGSAREIRGALELAERCGWYQRDAQLEEVLDRELRLLYGLTKATGDEGSCSTHAPIHGASSKHP